MSDRDRPERDREGGSRLAVIVVFFALGASGASWAARLPAIKGRLDLSAGVLGLVLLGPAVGSVLAMPPAGWVLRRVGPRRLVQVAFIPLALLVPLVAIAGSAWQLFAVLAAWGAAAGVIDVGMNTEAAALQDRVGRRIMSGFHGAYSVGGLAGAGLAAVAAAIGLTVSAHLLLVGIVVLATGLAATERFASTPTTLGSTATEACDPPTKHMHLSRTLVALAAVAFGCFLAEGAANDWSAVYLHSSLGASAALSAVAYTLFCAAMASGRLCGDRLADRFGATRLVRFSAGAAAVGFAGALILSETVAGLAGFIVLGLGLASVVPLVFTAASRLGEAGPNLAVVAGSGYAGFLVGPALIGGLADAVGLPSALGAVVVVSAVAALLAPAVAAQPSAEIPLPQPDLVRG